METGERPDHGVCAAVDVHYLSTGGTRAAAVVAADGASAHVLTEHTAVPGSRPTGRATSPARTAARYARSCRI
jgi:hypothetical protein